MDTSHIFTEEDLDTEITISKHCITDAERAIKDHTTKLNDPEKLEHPEGHVFVSIPSTFHKITIPLPAFHRVLDKIEDVFLTE